MAGISGKRKAAMLLTNLDTASAAELLKGQPQEVIQEIAIEMSQLDKSGVDRDDHVEVAREFCSELQKTAEGGMHVKSFINNLLKSTAGKEKSAEMHAQMQKAIHDKDPFLALSSATPVQMAAALEGEPPQAIALVLTNIPPKIATETLARMEDEISNKVVWRMTQPVEVSPRTLRRIGEMVCKRLVELTSDEEGGAIFEESLPKETLRKVALVLSGLPKEKRDVFVDEITTNDEDIAKMVKALMVTWEDIPKIEDRSLQEILRKVDASILAKALHGADAIISNKILSNISERAREMVDEEKALMAEPRKKEVFEAREEVAKPLREANEAEKLTFIEEE